MYLAKGGSVYAYALLESVIGLASNVLPDASGGFKHG